jgi:tRNA A-37 threonylcarbamoyl transferase component Bud32
LAVIGASFAGYFALLVWADARRPEPSGIVYTAGEGGLVVADVVGGSPASRAGLRAGDRITRAAGRPISTRFDWNAFEANLTAPSRPPLEIARGPERTQVALDLDRAAPRFWLTMAGATVAIARAVQFITLVVAFVLAMRRPRDPHALVGAWLLGTLAVYSVAWPYGFAVRWRDLPWMLGLPLWVPYVSSLSISAVLATFFTIFPDRLRWAPRAWIAIWIPAATVAAVQLANTASIVYDPTGSGVVRDWSAASVASTILYTLVAAALIVLGYRRLADVTLRRRVRVMAIGSLIGMAGFVPIVIAAARADALRGSTVFASPWMAAGALVGLVLPASFAYAILRHRLFDVGFYLRRTLQYALARRVVVSVVPLLTTVLAADVLLNRQRPLADVLAAHGWIYAGMAGLAIAARIRRDHWLDAIDRRFFRERYSAQRLLRSIGDEIRRAPDLGTAGALVVRRIQAALHAEPVALLVRPPDEAQYAAVAVAPAGATVEPLAAESAIVGLLRVLKKPLQVPLDGRTLARLPSADADWLARHRIELLVPVAVGDRAGTYFAFGQKQSEEPYSAEDEDLLMTLAHGLALLLPRAATATVLKDEGCEECPACGHCDEPGTGRCPRDGSPLARLQIPRMLSGRYRLLRRIGRGGMGTVYAATDDALARSVAVKVLREDLIDETAEARFRSEAQLAASLVHPNVVTVFDFGVTESGRPFFVMELLDGVSLRDELRRTRLLPAARALRILRDVCAALDAAHLRRLIHRDVKPDNIFLCRGRSGGGETAKVLDFGVAKALEASGSSLLTQTGVVAGTLAYMAPEHLRGEEPSPDWDLWALGVVACEMLTGHAPRTVPGAAPDLDPLPERLRPVFAKALSLNPLDRPTSAGELVRALEASLDAGRAWADRA